MTTDLDRLIEAVEAGEGNRNDGTLYRLFGDSWVHAWDVIDRDSIDAAVALLEALLPGWGWLCGVYGARVWEYPGDEWNRERHQDVEMPSSPARALLLATLRAYRSTREARHDPAL